MAPQRIGSHYLLHEQIGQGGMGAVWRAEDTEAETWCAVKVLRPEYARDPAAVARFVRERTALMALKHPNVVTLHDMIVEGEQLALVMDLLTDGDLDKFRRDHGGALPPGLAAELVAQVCDGLAAAHAQGIVHRDLKPGNVLMDAGRARLTDFGIARIGGEAAVTVAGTVLGTVSYMAPEALAGAEAAPACDVYAAGVTLYELLAGRPPFTGQAAMVIYDHLHVAPRCPDGVPGPLWQLIAACLAKDPAARPSAAELAAALRHPRLLCEQTVPHPGASWLGAPAEAVAPQAAPPDAAPHTIAGIGWLSPAGPVPREPVPSGPLPPLVAGAPEVPQASWARRRRAWLIAAAAVLLLAGAGIGAFAAEGGGSPAKTEARSVTVPSLAAQAAPDGAGRSISPTPRHSVRKAVPRSTKATSPAPVAAVPPADNAESDPTPFMSTVTVTSSAPATSAPTTAPPTTAPPAPAPTVTVTVAPCGTFPSAGTSFWRCNGSAWLPISCASGENNGTNGPYNVLKAVNQCRDRVWLHEYAYPQDVNSGWTYCISPGATVDAVPADFQNPLNIQVTVNPNAC